MEGLSKKLKLLGLTITGLREIIKNAERRKRTVVLPYDLDDLVGLLKLRISRLRGTNIDSSEIITYFIIKGLIYTFEGPELEKLYEETQIFGYGRMLGELDATIKMLIQEIKKGK